MEKIWNYIIEKKIIVIINLTLALATVIMILNALTQIERTNIIAIYSSGEQCKSSGTCIQFQNDEFCFIKFDDHINNCDYYDPNFYKYKWGKNDSLLFLTKANTSDRNMPKNIYFKISVDTLICTNPYPNYKLTLKSKLFEKDCIYIRE